jgi:hypothetical protein
MDFIEEYRGFEIFVDLGSQRTLAFWAGAQVSEYIGDSLEDVRWQIDSYYFHTLDTTE